MSKLIYDSDNDDDFLIQGPMGKGLGLGNSGTHIAFTAGTGCLVFIDLVAHLVRKNLGLLSEVEEHIIEGSDFKFIFYVSFHKREDAIGLELMEGL